MKNIQILIFSVLQIIILYVVIKESKSTYKSYVNKELKLNHLLFFIIISISLSFYFVRNIIRLANLE
jgi:hypothetical protein